MFSIATSVQESNILTNNNNTTSILQLFFFIIAFIFVLVLAVYSTRLLASSSYLKNRNKNIKVLESIGIGYHNSIQLIQIGNRYILIGNTKEKVTLLLDLKQDDIALSDLQDNEFIYSSFKKYYNKHFKKEPSNRDGEGDNGV